MREVIRGVVDVIRTAGIRRAERHSHDDGEPFVMPPEAEDTREDTAYAAGDTRDTAPTGRGESESERGHQKNSSISPQSTSPFSKHCCALRHVTRPPFFECQHF